jgi:hypothetical protein
MPTPISARSCATPSRPRAPGGCADGVLPIAGAAPQGSPAGVPSREGLGVCGPGSGRRQSKQLVDEDVLQPLCSYRSGGQPRSDKRPVDLGGGEGVNDVVSVALARSLGRNAPAQARERPICAWPCCRCRVSSASNAAASGSEPAALTEPMVVPGVSMSCAGEAELGQGVGLSPARASRSRAACTIATLNSWASATDLR